MVEFVDTNVYLDALLEDTPPGDRARELLRTRSALLTSVLVMDEVLWVLRKKVGARAALDMAIQLAHGAGQRILAVTPDHWRSAMNLMDTLPRMKPRDAMHAAVAIDHRCDAIISTDDDFDDVPGLVRISP